MSKYRSIKRFESLAVVRKDRLAEDIFSAVWDIYEPSDVERNEGDYLPRFVANGAAPKP